MCPSVRQRTLSVCSGVQTIHARGAQHGRVPQLGVSMFLFASPQRPQIFFHVREMTSPRAADAVREALMQLDERATVRIDLNSRRVEIDSNGAEPSAFRNAIADAGYASLRQWPSERAYL
jgi:copper chaperone CopZ